MANSEDRLKKFEEVLDQYQYSFGLDKLSYNDKVDQYLTLNEESIKHLDERGCAEASYFIAQYTAVLNKEYSRNKVRVFWAENELNKLVAHYHSQYAGQFMKFETMRAKIINEDSAASALNNIVLHAKARMLQLEEVIKDIQTLGRILQNMGRR